MARIIGLVRVYLCCFAIAVMLFLGGTYWTIAYAASDYSSIRNLYYNDEPARSFAQEWLYCYSIYGVTWSTPGGHRRPLHEYSVMDLRLAPAEIVLEIGWPFRWAESRYDAMSPHSPASGTIRIRPRYMSKAEFGPLASSVRFLPVQSFALLGIMTIGVRGLGALITKKNRRASIRSPREAIARS